MDAHGGQMASMAVAGEGPQLNDTLQIDRHTPLLTP